MEDAIRDEGRRHRASTRVVCRTGSPIDLDDLEIVNPQRGALDHRAVARTSDDPDSRGDQDLLALTHARAGARSRTTSSPRSQDPTNLEAARLVGGDEAVLIDKRETIVAPDRADLAAVGRLRRLHRAARLRRRRDLLPPGPGAGRARPSATRCSPTRTARVIGLRVADGDVQLNPPLDTPIGPGDSVIAIAEDDVDVLGGRAARSPARSTRARSSSPQRARAEPERVAHPRLERRAPAVIHELDDYVAPGSSVTVVADVDEPRRRDRARVRRGSRNLEVELPARRHDRPRARSRRSASTSYDHVIVLCYSDTARRASAPTRARSSRCCTCATSPTARGAEFSIVSEMLDDRNRELAQVTKVDDVIVSDKLISLMLAQISENQPPACSTTFRRRGLGDLHAARRRHGTPATSAHRGGLGDRAGRPRAAPAGRLARIRTAPRVRLHGYEPHLVQAGTRWGWCPCRRTRGWFV